MRPVLGPGALGRPSGIGWRGRWEGGSGWGTHVNPWLFHFNVWQNPLQKKKKEKKRLFFLTESRFSSVWIEILPFYHVECSQCWGNSINVNFPNSPSTHKPKNVVWLYNISYQVKIKFINSQFWLLKKISRKKASQKVKRLVEITVEEVQKNDRLVVQEYNRIIMLSFNFKWKWKSLSHVRLFATSWTIQEFSRTLLECSRTEY